MTEGKSRGDSSRRPSQDPVLKKGGYTTPATPVAKLPVVPKGPAPGATPGAAAGQKK